MSRYAVIDLEMCRVLKNKKDSSYHFSQEVIQIGAVLLDESYEVVDTYMSFVSPQYGTVDRFIEKLTGIRQSDVAYAPDTRTAFEEFTRWLPEDSVIAAWSTSDEKQLRNEIKAKNLEIPVLVEKLDNCLDCQELFSTVMETRKVYNLTEALTIADIDYQNGAHDALVDAYNTALLLKKLETEDDFTLSSWYKNEDEVLLFTSNPFAVLLKNPA